MVHIILCYRMVNGCYQVDPENAGRIRRLYESYLSGMSVKAAGEAVGIHKCESSLTHMMKIRQIWVTIFSLQLSTSRHFWLYAGRERRGADHHHGEHRSAGEPKHLAECSHGHTVSVLPMINVSRFLGYRKDDDGKMAIDEGEARIIRWIFRAYIEGFSPKYIAGRLRKNNVRSGSGKTTWPVSTVRYILQNEKYIGDLLLQKTLVSDFLTHKSAWRRGRRCDGGR